MRQRLESIDASEGARATAAWALGADAKREEVREVLLGMAVRANSARVRRAALVAALEGGVEEETTLETLKEVAQEDESASVRSLAVVALGRPELEGVGETLTKACADRDPQVAICAIVSLGKNRSEGALDTLRGLCEDADWRVRGAAVVGLSHLFDKEAIPIAIERLADPMAVVARTAHEFVADVTKQDLPRDVEAYRAWWAEYGKVVYLMTPEEARKRGIAYADFGGKSVAAPYKDMDVFVFESHGDHIQSLMERRGIDYTLTGSGKVSRAEVHPFGVYVANCIGDCSGSDVEFLAWYVLTGGYLFSSCWALNGTMVAIEPGVMRSVPQYIQGTLQDRVAAEMTVAASPYLEGVFSAGMTPIYSLEGAHLIEVLKPERCEVLMDSSECAARWGYGTLAAWFDVGHGLMLDSANHFDAQGFGGAEGLKTPEDRQAYAVNHMGLTFEELRLVQKEKWWKANSKAEEFVWDESAFRFLTNFVRWKRVGGR